jgi:predicted nicotinamide N-methyase
MWPSAVILARWIASFPERITNKSVLELGSGCGLTGLVAAQVTSAHVLQSDFNDQVLDNLHRNIVLNNLSRQASTAKLDFYQQIDRHIQNTMDQQQQGWIDGCDSSIRPAVDIVVAADVICKASDAVALAHTLKCCLSQEGKAYIVCATSHHRFGVDRLEEECHAVGLGIKSTPVADILEGQLLSRENGLEQTSGFVEGMEFTFFEISNL